MSTSSNPLTGSSWGTNTPPPNPLMGWPGQNVNQSTSVLPPPSPVQAPPQGAFGNPGNLPNPNSNVKDITRNTGVVNLETGQLRNQLIPMFANLMQGYAGPAADFFKKLMDFGSPFYQQKQQEGFTQGVEQNDNASATARQELDSAGYGATPSGANAGMIGGMNIAGGKSLAEQFLQNLFQNENLQTSGAQGLEQLAAMFNPSSLFGNVSTPGSTQGPAAAEQFGDVLKGVGSLFGSKGIPTGG